MPGAIRTSSFVALLLLLTQLPGVPPNAIPAAEAARLVTRWLQSHDYYSVSDDCLEPRDARYQSRGYVLNVVPRCVPAAKPLGRWRVDAFTRDVFVMDTRGIFVPPVAEASSSARNGYRPVAVIPLHEADGMDGSLELLLDARVTPEMLRVGGAALDAPDAQAFRPELRNARLLLADGRNRPVQVKTLERPLASLEAAHLRGDGRRSFLLTVDYSASLDGDHGPLTSVLEADAGSWEFVDARDEDASVWQRLVVADTPRAAWRKVPHGGEASDILAVACLPDSSRLTSDLLWITTLERYRFVDRGWVRYQSARPDACWDNEDFPSDDEFPSVP